MNHLSEDLLLAHKDLQPVINEELESVGTVYSTESKNS